MSAYDKPEDGSRAVQLSGMSIGSSETFGDLTVTVGRAVAHAAGRAVEASVSEVVVPPNASRLAVRRDIKGFGQTVLGIGAAGVMNAANDLGASHMEAAAVAALAFGIAHEIVRRCPSPRRFFEARR